MTNPLREQLVAIELDKDCHEFNELSEDVISQIEQAFKDAGYTRMNAVELVQEYLKDAGLMTGQEFVDRFAKEVKGLGMNFDYTFEEDVIDAAKRAAGLE